MTGRSSHMDVGPSARGILKQHWKPHLFCCSVARYSWELSATCCGHTGAAFALAWGNKHDRSHFPCTNRMQRAKNSQKKDDSGKRIQFIPQLQPCHAELLPRALTCLPLRYNIPSHPGSSLLYPLLFGFVSAPSISTSIASFPCFYFCQVLSCLFASQSFPSPIKRAPYPSDSYLPSRAFKCWLIQFKMYSEVQTIYWFRARGIQKSRQF